MLNIPAWYTSVNSLAPATKCSVTARSIHERRYRIPAIVYGKSQPCAWNLSPQTHPNRISTTKCFKNQYWSRLPKALWEWTENSPSFVISSGPQRTNNGKPKHAVQLKGQSASGSGNTNLTGTGGEILAPQPLLATPNPLKAKWLKSTWWIYRALCWYETI